MAALQYTVSHVSSIHFTALIPDTEAPSAAEPPADPFAHIEKTIDQQTWVKTKTSRLTELQQSADRLSSDPYVVSAALRRKFREEKKIMLEKQGRDDDVRARYGLHDDVDLGVEDVEKSREMWEAGRERAGLPIEEAESGLDASVRAVNGAPRTRGPERIGGSLDLAKALRKTTARKYDPFADVMDDLFSASKPSPRARPKVSERVVEATTKKEDTPSTIDPTPTFAGLGGGLLAGYGSD